MPAPAGSGAAAPPLPAGNERPSTLQVHARHRVPRPAGRAQGLPDLPAVATAPAVRAQGGADPPAVAAASAVRGQGGADPQAVAAASTVAYPAHQQPGHACMRSRGSRCCTSSGWDRRCSCGGLALAIYVRRGSSTPFTCCGATAAPTPVYLWPGYSSTTAHGLVSTSTYSHNVSVLGGPTITDRVLVSPHRAHLGEAICAAHASWGPRPRPA